MGSLPINRQGESHLCCSSVTPADRTSGVQPWALPGRGSWHSPAWNTPHQHMSQAHGTNKKVSVAGDQNLIFNSSFLTNVQIQTEDTTLHHTTRNVMALQPAPANWRWSTVTAAKPNTDFHEKKLLLKFKFQFNIKSLSPVIMTEKYLRMLKRKPRDKQVTSHVFAAEHHEWLR